MSSEHEVVQRSQPHILAALRDVCAVLYPEERDTRVVVADAGLDEHQVAFSPRAETNWHNIWLEAIRQNRVDALLAVMAARYPTNPSLQATITTYHRFLATGGRLDAQTLLTATDDTPAPGDPPYQGMAYYDVADADRFFGREALTAALVDHLRQQPLLAVVGASGSGKSSLVRAGVMPALQGKTPLVDGKQPPIGSSRWVYPPIITPTAHPLKMLAAALTPANESILAQAQLMDALLVEPRSLDLYAHRLVKSDQRLLLVVDQFEELFTLCKDESEQQAFIDNLLSAATPDGVVTLVLTLRADFYHHCARFPALRTALENQQKYIGAMTPDELRRAIEEPANAGQWDFQAGLVEQLLQAVGHEPGALPLLSHALLETWQRRRGRTLTLAGYRAAGGVQGAIAKTADDVFNRFTNEQKTIARSIFLRLTELGEGVQDTRRRIRPDELKLTNASAEEVQQVLNTLADARLVTTDDDEIQVSHEALIRDWETLREWLDDDREGLRIHRHLTEMAQEWQANSQESGNLYRGNRLSRTQEWADHHATELSHLEQRFLQASQLVVLQEKAERERGLRVRRYAWLLAVIAFIAIMATVYSVGQSQQARSGEQRAVAAKATADVAKREAQYAATRAYQAEVSAKTAQAKTETLSSYVHADSLQKESLLVRNTKPQLALLLGIEAMQVQEQRGEPHTTNAAYQLYVDSHVTGMPLVVDGVPIVDVAFSPNGRWLAAAEEGGIHLWHVPDFVKAAFVLRSDRNKLTAIAFSYDSQWLVGATKAGVLFLWALNTPERKPLSLYQSNNEIYKVAFSPAGRWLASADADGLIHLWDIQKLDTLPTTLNSQGMIHILAFSPDGRWLVADGEKISVWDVSTQDGSPITLTTTAVKDLTFINFDDGTPAQLALLLADREKSMIELWAAGNWQGTPITLSIELDDADAFAFHPQQKHLAVAADTLVRLWELPELYQLGFYDNGYGHEAQITSLVFSPDGAWLATAAQDHTIRIWGGTFLYKDPAQIKMFPQRSPFPIGELWSISSNTLNSYYRNIDPIDPIQYLNALRCTDEFGLDCIQGGHGCVCEMAKPTPQERAAIVTLSCQRVGRNLTREEWQHYFPNEAYRSTCPQWPPGS